MSEPILPNLREIRESRGLSLRDLATLCKIDHAHLSRIESGENIPSRIVLRKICGKLKIDFELCVQEVKDRVMARALRQWEKSS